MSESELYGQILRACSNGGSRLFRQQSGMFWTGRIIRRDSRMVVLADPRAVRVGTPGMTDLGGVTSVIITPEMVGQRVGIDVQIEVKERGRLTVEQRAYLETMQRLGSRAGVARSVDEATAIILGER